MATIPVKRTQLMLARKLWERPTKINKEIVERQVNAAYEKGLLSRDEKEVLDLMLDLLGRSWA